MKHVSGASRARLKIAFSVSSELHCLWLSFTTTTHAPTAVVTVSHMLFDSIVLW